MAMQEYNLEGGANLFRNMLKTTKPPTPAPETQVPTPVEENIDVTHGKLVELASLFKNEYDDITKRTIFDLEPVTKFIFNNITPKLDNSIVGYSLQQSYTELLNEITDKLCKIKEAAAAAGEKIDFFSQDKSDFANTIQTEIDNITRMSSDVAIKKSLEDKEEKTSQAAMAKLESRKQAAKTDLDAKETELTAMDEQADDQVKLEAKKEVDAARATLDKLTVQLESLTKDKAAVAEEKAEEERVANLTKMQSRPPPDQNWKRSGGGSRRNKNKKSKRGKRGKRGKKTRKN